MIHKEEEQGVSKVTPYPQGYSNFDPRKLGLAPTDLLVCRWCAYGLHRRKRWVNEAK